MPLEFRVLGFGLILSALAPLEASPPAGWPQRSVPASVQVTLSIQAEMGLWTIDRVRQVALARHPSLADARASIEQATADVTEAGFLPNPVLQVEGEEMVPNFSIGPGLLMNTISQTILTGGKRRWRIGAALGALEKAGLVYEQKALEVVRDVTRAFYERLGAERKLQVALGLAELAGKFHGIVAARVKGGNTRPIEADRALVQSAQSRFEIQRARAELATANQSLASAMGRSDANGLLVKGNLDHQGKLPPLDRLVAQAREAAPFLRVPVAEEEIARKELQLGHALRYPDVDVGLSVQHRSDPERSHDLRGFQISLPLPVRNRGQAARARARAGIQGAQSRRELAWVDLKNRLVAAYQTGQRAHDQVEVYLGEVLPAARRAVDLSTAGYEAGKFIYLEVLDAQRSLSGAMQTYIEALVEYQKARADLEALVAGRVPEVPEDPEDDEAGGEVEQATSHEQKTDERSSAPAEDPHSKKESR